MQQRRPDKATPNEPLPDPPRESSVARLRVAVEGGADGSELLVMMRPKATERDGKVHRPTSAHHTPSHEAPSIAGRGGGGGVPKLLRVVKG